MIAIDDTLVSEDIADRHFVCDLSKCKGACCKYGDNGAPLEKAELPMVQNVLCELRPYLSPKAMDVISEVGHYVADPNCTYSTPTIDGKECVYANYNNNNVLTCAFESAYFDGKIDFQKPISCHLYPIRVHKLNNCEALNYHRWKICNAACQLGSRLGIPIYRFVKDGLIRKYGEDWYAKLVEKFERKHTDSENGNVE